jgi:hypothetical protein
VTFIPSTRAINAMCKLLADYRANADTREALAEIRRELGDEQYKLFERELLRQMRTAPAWKGVSNIISAAVRRKKTLMVQR